MIGALVFGLAYWSWALGAKGYFENYCFRPPDAPQASSVRGPSFDIVGRTVTCHYTVYRDQTQSRETIDVIYRDATPLIRAAVVLGMATGAVLLVGFLVLRRPQIGLNAKQSIEHAPP